MKVKTFHALTMQDAIRAIKEELGPEAIILSSKEVQQGGRLLRLFNRPILEVMAAAEEDLSWNIPPAGETSRPAMPVAPASAVPPPRRPAEPAGSASSASGFQETLHAMMHPPVAAPRLPAGPPAPTGAAAPAIGPVPAGKRNMKRDRMKQLRAELQDVSERLGALLPALPRLLGHHLPADLALLCQSLISQGLRPSTAESLAHELWSVAPAGKPDADAFRTGLHRLLAGRIRASGPLLAGRGDRTISLMLGPSGAGKTTAVTKLAARYRLEEKTSVAIITFDTYRQASVEQLRMYARVLGVPFASAVSPRQVCDGLRRQPHADVVLIDMPGIGPEEVASAKELHHRLNDESAVNMQVVLPASMREQDLFRLYDQVKELPLLRLLFTKLDETTAFGSIFELAYQTGVPLSYWSAGQRVPEDIEIATPDRLATFLLAQRHNAPTVPDSLGRATTSSHDRPHPDGVLAGQNERQALCRAVSTLP